MSKVAGAGKFAISERVREVAPEWPIGETIACPVCGRPGRASITTAKGARERYVYRVVYHSATDRCIVKGAIAKVTATGEVVRVEGERGRRVHRGAERAAAPVAAFAEEVPAQVQVQPAEVVGVRAIEEVREAVNRYMWYAFIVGRSWGAVDAAVQKVAVEEAVSHFRNQARKFVERLAIPAEEAVAAVEAYARNPTDEARRIASEKAADIAKQVGFVFAEAVAAAVQRRAAARPAIDPRAFAEAVAEEVRRQVEEAVRRVEESVKVPEVRVSKEDYAAMHAVFRRKKSVPEEVSKKAYRVWDQVFSPGRKVVIVEG